MKVLMQSSCLPMDQLHQTLDALDNLSIQYADFGMIPFTDELVGVESQYTQPVLLLGSCKMVKVARQHYPHLQPGVFFDEEAFQVETWCQQLGSMMLNHDSEVTTFAELLEPFEGHKFLRPLGDLKQFNGTELTHPEYVEWFQNNYNPDMGIVEDGFVAAASAKNIAAEWRCFMVEGKAVSGSRYRKGGHLKVEDSFPADVAVFAEAMAERWTPAPVYVIDIAQLNDGTYRVIEFNCFNASGWYKTDRAKVLNAVYAYVVDTYGLCSECDGSGWTGCRSMSIPDPACDPGMTRCHCGADPDDC